MKKIFALLFIVCPILLSAQTKYIPSMSGFQTNPTIEFSKTSTDSNGLTTVSVTLSATGGVSNKTTTSINLPLVADMSGVQKSGNLSGISNGVLLAYGRINTRSGSNTADLCYGNGGFSSWSSTGTKSFCFVLSYYSIPLWHRMIFDGNSLTTHSSTSGISYRLRDSLMRYSLYAPMQNYAVSGRTTSVLKSEFATKVRPCIASGDMLFFWEITNDISTGITASQAYSNVLAYIDSVRITSGIKIILLTGIPRNDNVNYWAKIDSVNNMIRADTSIADLVVNLNAMTQFDARLDADNTTYYNADKVHLTAAGEQAISDFILPRLRQRISSWY